MAFLIALIILKDTDTILRRLRTAICRSWPNGWVIIIARATSSAKICVRPAAISDGSSGTRPIRNKTTLHVLANQALEFTEKFRFLMRSARLWPCFSGILLTLRKQISIRMKESEAQYWHTFQTLFAIKKNPILTIS